MASAGRGWLADPSQASGGRAGRVRAATSDSCLQAPSDRAYSLPVKTIRRPARGSDPPLPLRQSFNQAAGPYVRQRNRARCRAGTDGEGSERFYRIQAVEDHRLDHLPSSTDARELSGGGGGVSLREPEPALPGSGPGANPFPAAVAQPVPRTPRPLEMSTGQRLCGGPTKGGLESTLPSDEKRFPSRAPGFGPSFKLFRQPGGVLRIRRPPGRNRAFSPGKPQPYTAPRNFARALPLFSRAATYTFSGGRGESSTVGLARCSSSLTIKPRLAGCGARTLPTEAPKVVGGAD